jgi:hypothetical protein
LDDSDREFVISDFLKLETLPKPTFHRRTDEIAFMEDFFSSANGVAELSAALAEKAMSLASAHDIAPMDSLHLASAMSASAEEFITTEKPTKPMFRVTGLQVKSLHVLEEAIPPEIKPKLKWPLTLELQYIRADELPARYLCGKPLPGW